MTLTFIALFVTDVLNTLYLKSVADGSPLVASSWATAVTLAASVGVINYTNDHIMLIPALLGAFAGTYIGMLIKRR